MNAVDRYGGTPALDAVRHRHADVLAFLRAHGARLPAEAIKGAAAGPACAGCRRARLSKLWSELSRGRYSGLAGRVAWHASRMCSVAPGRVAAMCLAETAPLQGSFLRSASKVCLRFPEPLLQRAWPGHFMPV